MSPRSRLKDITDIVQLPEGGKFYRGIPIALTTISRKRDLAKTFVDFLKTGPAHAVFQEWD